MESSVIIPCHRADGFLPLQLDALAQQVEAQPFEVLLVDNGNNTDLAGLARAYGERLSIRVIDATAEQGTGFARNTGMKAASTDYLLFCDADDAVIPTWVRDGVAQLRRWPAFSGGAIPLPASQFELGYDALMAEVGPLVEASTDPLPECGIGDYPILLGCSFGMTREVARAVGGFDRSFGAQAEDNDLAFRLKNHLGSLPAARHVAVAYRTRSVCEETVRRAFDAGRKHAMLCLRHAAWNVSPSTSGRWLLRPAREFAASVRAGQPNPYILVRTAGLVYGKAYYALRGLPQPRPGVGRTS